MTLYTMTLTGSVGQQQQYFPFSVLMALAAVAGDHDSNNSNIQFGMLNNILLFKLKIEQRARAPC